MPGLDGFEVASALGRGADAPSPLVIMLSSLHDQGDRDRCVALGIAQFLVKPVSPSSLYDALVTAIGRTPAARRTAHPGLPAPAELAHVPPGMRILVAEDNAVNIAVVERLLGRVGLHPEVARDGAQALAALQRAE